MTQGIRRFKVRQDGSIHSWYRYPVTDIYKGEYCPICLQKSVAQDCHHVVSRVQSRVETGYEQHWHNNIINICTMCHERTIRELEDSLLIRKRIIYFMSAVHGMRTWINREIFRKACDKAKQLKKDCSKHDNYSFLSWVYTQENILKYLSISHYHASFGNEYIQKINSEETELFFMNEKEMQSLIFSLPTKLTLGVAAASRLKSLFIEDNNSRFIRSATRKT